jgi:hypothetical protein
MSKGREKLWRVKYMEGYKIYTWFEINGVKECFDEKNKEFNAFIIVKYD